MKKFTLCAALFATLYCFMPAKAEAQIYVCNYGYVYGLSYILDDPLTNTVYGYSATGVDFCAGLDYDPYVNGYLFQGNTLVSSGASLGYADLIDAVVTTSAVRTPLIRYSQVGDHYVRTVFYDGPGYGFRDPFGFSFFDGGTYGGSGSFFGGYGFTYSYYQYIYLGRTLVQITPLLICTGLPSGSSGESFIYGEMDNANPPPEAACPTPTPTPTPQFQATLTVDTPLRPAGVSGTATKARVTITTTPATRNVPITLKAEGVPNTGGHIDANHTPSNRRPTGTLRATRGRTNSAGVFQTTYTPSHIAGNVKITGTAGNLSGEAFTQVLVQGLQELGAGDNYVLIGSNTPHPRNHWGTPQANTGLGQIADDYKNEYYRNRAIPEDDKLHYNDMSLEYGGKFDLGLHWAATGHHDEHREGINADVRCCQVPGNVPRDRWARLNEIFTNRGSPGTVDETRSRTAPHWHLVFSFGRPQAPIIRSVENFVDAATWGALDRGANESEWQNWSDRLTKAKAQGKDQMLLEAKLFMRTLLQSGEYVDLNRSDEEYVTSLYEAYFQREPTDDESGIRLQALQSSDATGANAREVMLEDFENSQEFADLVVALVEALPVSLCDPVAEQTCNEEGGTWDPGGCSCRYGRIRY